MFLCSSLSCSFAIANCELEIQGFEESKGATTPSAISEVPHSDEVACGGYHTCVVTSEFSNSFTLT